MSRNSGLGAPAVREAAPVRLVVNAWRRGTDTVVEGMSGRRGSGGSSEREG